MFSSGGLEAGIGLETTMMRQWIGHRKPEDVATMIQEMMPMMLEKMGPQGIVTLMSRMMSEAPPSVVHDIMPKVVYSCFSGMAAEQRCELVSMCRDLLDQIEEQ